MPYKHQHSLKTNTRKPESTSAIYGTKSNEHKRTSQTRKRSTKEQKRNREENRATSERNKPILRHTWKDRANDLQSHSCCGAKHPIECDTGTPHAKPSQRSPGSEPPNWHYESPRTPRKSWTHKPSNNPTGERSSEEYAKPVWNRRQWVRTSFERRIRSFSRKA